MGREPAEYLCLPFRLGSRIFTKLIEIPVVVLRSQKIRVTVCLDIMLLMSQMVDKI